MSTLVAPRNIIVTGGASGIGKAVAQRRASEGYNVAILDFNVEGAASVAEELGATYPNISVPWHFVDVSDEESVDRAVASVREEFAAYGGIGQLVHAAGRIDDGPMFRRNKETGERRRMPLSQFKGIIDNHVIGTFLVNRAVTDFMIEDGVEGSVVNLSSISRYGNRGQVNYAAAKAAIAGFSASLALELAQYLIRINAFAPGFTATPMTDALKLAILEHVAARTPLGRRLATSQEMSQAICHLLDETYTSGQTRDSDGLLCVGPNL